MNTACPSMTARSPVCALTGLFILTRDGETAASIVRSVWLFNVILVKPVSSNRFPERYNFPRMSCGTVDRAGSELAGSKLPLVHV